MKKELLEKIQGYRSTQWSTYEIWEKLQLQELNLTPPYQRNEVWTPDFQRNLISSIFAKYPIPHLTLVENENDDGWVVLDGKQRISSLKAFFDNRLTVEHPSLNKKSIKYNDLKDSTDRQITKEYSEFKNSKLHVVILPKMSWIEQRDVFMVLNHSVQLGSNEKTYCNNFHAKAFLEWVWEEALSGYLSLIKEKKFMARFNNIRFVHGLLSKLYGDRMSCFSPVLTNGWGIEIPKINKYATMLHDSLISINHKEGDKVSFEICNKLGILKNLETFIKVSKCIKSVFERDALTSKWHSLIIRDALLYFVDLEHRNIFTISMLQEYEDVVERVLRNYSVVIMNNDDLKKASLNDYQITKRLTKLDDIFRSECTTQKIDLNEKRKLLSAKEKRLAKLTSDGKCPIDGRVLTEENCQIDHVNPKSKSSVKIAVAICNSCNLRKSNWSSDEFTKFNDYIETYAIKNNEVLQ